MKKKTSSKISRKPGKTAKAHRPKTPAGRPTPRESVNAQKKRAAKILHILRMEFPGAGTALLHENPFQLLIATILSAQCTDERVNIVTRELFSKYKTPGDFATVSQAVLEQEIRSTGFFRMKAKNIIGCSKALVERHGSRVPSRMENLLQLPGVGRKTANVVLGQAFGIASGVVVDTHVHRLSRRLGLSTADTPEQIEQDLMEIYPANDWIDVGSIVILHGRRTCNARKPQCTVCSLSRLCPSAEFFIRELPPPSARSST